MRTLVETTARALTDKETALDEAYTRAVVLQRDVQAREKMLVSAQAELDTLKADVMALEGQKQDLEDRLHRARGDVAGEMALVTSTMLKMKEDALSQATARNAQLTQELEALRASSRGAAAPLARQASE
jgi:predicted  nucleic acid-binding Zn-ribbon protein